MRAHPVPIAVLAAVLAVAGALDAAPKKRPAVDVTGTYDSNYDRVTLTQRGTLIEGEYVCCGGGSITGRLDGRVIHYRWAQGEDTGGRGVWHVEADGSLVGTWGAEDSEDDGGEWNLERVDSIAN